MEENSARTGIIVPCHNEAKRIDVDEFNRIIAGFDNYVFCFIDDGSTDDTLKVLQGFRERFAGRVYVICNKTNLGKAEAVRKGVNLLLSLNNTDLIGFMDADLSTPFSEIDCMANILHRSDQFEIVCGSRIKRMGARITRKRVRHVFGRMIATLISLSLNMPFYDTQCGAKIMSLKMARLGFQEPFSSSWLFDVEIFKRAQIHFKGQAEGVIYEHPLREWIHKDESKMKLTYLFKLPIHLFMIQTRYR
jgi:dolichyl-phosphate beta-glucosyltransferase